MDVAEKLRKTHKQEHPDYKYQPRRKKGRSLATTAAQCNGGSKSSLTPQNTLSTTVTENAAIVEDKCSNSTNVRTRTSDSHLLSHRLNAKQQRQQTQLQQQVNRHTNVLHAEISALNNETLMENLSTACKATLLTQNHDLHDVLMALPKCGNAEGLDSTGKRCDYAAKRLDSPCSTTSSLPSTGASATDGQPLTPPATPYARSLLGQTSVGRTTHMPQIVDSSTAEYNLLNIEGREFVTLDDCQFGSSINASSSERLTDELPSYSMQFSANRSYIPQNSLEFQPYGSSCGYALPSVSSSVVFSNVECGSSPTSHTIEPINYFNMPSPLTKNSERVGVHTTAEHGNDYLAPMAASLQTTTTTHDEDIEVDIDEQYFMEQIIPTVPNNNHIEHRNIATTTTMLNTTPPNASARAMTTLASTLSTSGPSNITNSTKSSLQHKIHDNTHMLPSSEAALHAKALVEPSLTSSLKCNSIANHSPIAAPSHGNDNFNCLYSISQHTHAALTATTKATAATINTLTAHQQDQLCSMYGMEGQQQQQQQHCYEHHSHHEQSLQQQEHQPISDVPGPLTVRKVSPLHSQSLCYSPTQQVLWSSYVQP